MPVSGPRSEGPSGSRAFAPGAALLTVTGLAVAAVIAFTVLRGRQEASEAGAVGTGGIAEVAPAPAPAPAPSQPPVDPDAETLEVEIRPSAVIWVTATADGERVLFRLLKPGEQVSVKARGDLSFRVGDAGAFQVLGQRRRRQAGWHLRRSHRVPDHPRKLPDVPSLI